LDAVASATSAGISKVVDTEYGFHIFKLNPAPEQATVTGAHIVIGYEEAQWLQMQKCTEIPRRSREEALITAAEVLRQLEDEPQSFKRLVQQYSDHCDALQGGDLGTWSNHEPSHIPLELQALQGLAVGEVAAPMDSKLGIQILQRTANRQRQQYAMDPVYLGFDPDAADQQAASRFSVRREAESLAKELANDPSRFERVKNERWNGPVEHWSEGKGFPLISRALDQIPFGQITPIPVNWGRSYVIARRIDPATLPTARPTRFELPAPAAPDLNYFASYMRTPFFDAQLRLVGERALAAQRLEGELAAEFRQLHENWAQYEALGREARAEKFRERQERLRELLGDQAYDTYRQRLNKHFAWLLLTPKVN
jgi:hypothetical protein